MQITGRNGRLTVQDKISGDRAMVRDTQKDLKAADLTEESFIFAPIEDLVLTGTDKRDDLAGRAGNDVFDGGLGPDVYERNGGSNTFVLWMDARDTVTDYELQHDLLDIKGWGVTSIDELNFQDRPGSILIRNGSNSAIVQTDGTFDSGDLDVSNFVFL